MVMKIKEVSEKTGLTKKTIRFYEEEGLIQPEKTYYNGRTYRDEPRTTQNTGREDFI